MRMNLLSYSSNVRRAFVGFVNNVSMRKKLFATFFIFMTIPFGTYITYSYNQSTRAQEEQMIYSEERAFEQALSLINYNVLNINRAMELTIMDETILAVLDRSVQDSYSTIDQIRDFLKLKDKVISLEKSQDMNRIRIYIKNGLLFSSENQSFYDMEKAQKSVWYQKLHNSSLVSLWCPPSYMTDDDEQSGNFIANVRILKNPTNYREDIGILRIDVEEQRIGKILTDAKVIPSSQVAIVNSAGDIVSSTDGFEALYAGALKMDLLELVKDKEDDVSHAWKGALNGETYLLQSSAIPGNDWMLLSMSPYRDIINIMDKLRNEMIMLLIGCVVLAYVISNFISYSITKRILKLMKQMNRVKSGDLQVHTMEFGKDEVGVLSNTFNYMVLQMKSYIEEKEQLGKEIKNSEFRALQAQINPHFLYNTLELIHWKAMEHQAPSVSAIVQTLAKFYKLSLSRGDEMITIFDEMEIARSYVRIQNMRFKNSIQLVEENMEELYEYKIPKIILQPLVENAILHGIRRKKEEQGTILVRGSMDDCCICIEVMDDGVGFTPERLAEIKSGQYESHRNGSGYGLKNIDSRLRLQYGEQFGLEIQSILHTGTHCYVRIPLIKGKEL